MKSDKDNQKLYTYEEISKKYNIGLSSLYSRVDRIKLIRRYDKQIRVFTKSEVKKIVNHKNPRLVESYKKITVIDFYHLGFFRDEISLRLGISLDFVKKTIAEYNRTGHVLVESKINRPIL